MLLLLESYKNDLKLLSISLSLKKEPRLSQLGLSGALQWKCGRVAECSGFLNRRGDFKGASVGSNPTISEPFCLSREGVVIIG